LPRNFLLLIMQQYTLESWNLGIWEALLSGKTLK
jgi:hypothetical protein